VDPVDEERITNLEIKLTYQDDLIRALNDVIVELRGEIDRLTRSVEALEGEVRGGGAATGLGAEERPPHY
jgi:SlyX protein